MIKRLKMFFGRIILKILPLQAFPKINRLCYILMGHSIGQDATLYSSVEMLGIIKVEIGKKSFVGHKTLFMGGNSLIKIGNNCDISSNVSLISGSHKIGLPDRRAGLGISKDIVIGNGVWIGYGSTILGGTNIGNGSIIAAGSLINSDVPENTVYGGVPAKEIRKIEDI